MPLLLLRTTTGYLFNTEIYKHRPGRVYARDLEGAFFKTMTRIERIAEELETSVYKDPMHGQIAKANFLYGVAQQKIAALEESEKKKVRELFEAGEVRLAIIKKAWELMTSRGFESYEDFVKAMEE